MPVRKIYLPPFSGSFLEVLWAWLGAFWRSFASPLGGAFPVSLPRFSNPVVASRGCFEGSSASGWELSGGSLGDPFWLEAAGLSFAPDWEPSGLFEHLTNSGAPSWTSLWGDPLGLLGRSGGAIQQTYLSYSNADRGLVRQNNCGVVWLHFYTSCPV